MTFVSHQGRAEVIESDICIIGSGITAAVIAEKLAEERETRIVVVEAGDDTVPLADRAAHRGRFVAYGESPWWQVRWYLANRAEYYVSMA